jgi:hypothetical protein
VTGTILERLQRWPTWARVLLACALCLLLAIVTALALGARL